MTIPSMTVNPNIRKHWKSSNYAISLIVPCTNPILCVLTNLAILQACSITLLGYARLISESSSPLETMSLSVILNKTTCQAHGLLPMHISSLSTFWHVLDHNEQFHLVPCSKVCFELQRPWDFPRVCPTNICIQLLPSLLLAVFFLWCILCVVCFFIYLFIYLASN